MQKDVDLRIEIKTDPQEGDQAWTVWKKGEFVATGYADSIEQAMFYIMNDLYGMQEVPLAARATEGAVKV